MTTAPPLAERTTAEPSALAEWSSACAELTKRLQRYPWRKAGPAPDHDSAPWEEYLARIDSLRASWQQTQAHEPPLFWRGWRDLVILYTALAERLPVTSRWRMVRAATFERIAWLYHQAFRWCWEAAEAIPELLWHGLFVLWEACVQQRIAWRRVVDPLTHEGKASPHELIAAVLLTYLVDPERTPPTTLARFYPLIAEFAPFLQIVPSKWLSPNTPSFYCFSADTWHSPRHPAAITEGHHPDWAIDLEALRLALQQNSSEAAAKDNATQDPHPHSARNIQALLAIINHRPAARSEPRQEALRQTVRLITGWEAISAHFSRLVTNAPPRETVSLIASHRIHLFGGWETETSDADIASQPDVWTVWDESPSGWQLVRTATEPEKVSVVQPQQLAALLWLASGNQRTEPILARVRWRNRTGQILRIGVQRFPYLQVQAITARPWQPPGELPRCWAAAFLLNDETGKQSLLVPYPSATRLLLHWEVCFKPQQVVPVLVDETFERGTDYCWFSFREL